MADWQPAAHKDYRWIVADPQLLGGKLAIRSRPIVPQIVHCPTVLDNQERYPFGAVLGDENPYSKYDGQRFDHPEEHVEDLFVARSYLVVGDVS
jgi:hypothetical protein